MDQQDARRLREFRATDSIGVYKCDHDVTGTSLGDRVTVTLDPLNRVISVLIAELDQEMRDSSVLANAVKDGYGDAIRKKLIASNTHRPRVNRPMPKAVPIRRPSPSEDRIAGPETPLPHPGSTYPVHGRQSRNRGPASGSSENGCVTVTLSPSGPMGVVEFESGWVNYASAQAVSSALTEAFVAANRSRKRKYL